MIIYIVTLLAAVGCYKDVSYNTTIVLRPSQQLESGGAAIELPGVMAYAFAVDTTEYQVTSYENALAGVMSSKESGEEVKAFASSTPYNNDVYGYHNSISLLIDADMEYIALVAVDTLNKDYGYTNYKVGVNLPITYIALNFAPWKLGSFKYGNWQFVVDDPYTPPLPPEVTLPEAPEVEEPETPETEVPEAETETPETEVVE